MVHKKTADSIRIISMSKENRHEQKLYFKNLKISSDFDEYPEITQADFERAIVRNGLELVDKKKQRITIMLDAGIVA